MNNEQSNRPAPEPSAPYLRIMQMDVLRGFAVLGIFWINIFIFALPTELGIYNSLLNESSPLNSFISSFSDTYIEGSMRGLFSMLFGASALIFLSEARLAANGLELVDRYYRRTLLLILFGILHAYFLLWPYDVLYDYGVLGLLLFPLRKLTARVLLIFGVTLLLIGDLAMVEVEWTEEADATLYSIDADSATGGSKPVAALSETPPPQAVNKQESASQAESNTEVIIYRSGYATIYHYQQDLVASQQSTTFYKDYLYDIGGMMLIGMALFKLGVLSGELSRIIYLSLAVGGFLLGALTRGAFIGNVLLPMPGFSELILELGGAYNLGRLFISLGFVGIICLLCSSSWFNPLTLTLSKVGRMALTNYIMQTIISLFLFFGLGLALFASLERYQLGLVCAGVWIFQILFSIAWLHWYKQGPLEWLWRSLIYGAWQPNRRLSS